MRKNTREIREWSQGVETHTHTHRIERERGESLGEESLGEKKGRTMIEERKNREKERGES